MSSRPQSTSRGLRYPARTGQVIECESDVSAVAGTGQVPPEEATGYSCLDGVIHVDDHAFTSQCSSGV